MQRRQNTLVAFQLDTVSCAGSLRKRPGRCSKGREVGARGLLKTACSLTECPRPVRAEAGLKGGTSVPCLSPPVNTNRLDRPVYGRSSASEGTLRPDRPHSPKSHVSSPQVPSTMRAWIFFVLCLAGRALAAPVSTTDRPCLGLPPPASSGPLNPPAWGAQRGP